MSWPGYAYNLLLHLALILLWPFLLVAALLSPKLRPGLPQRLGIGLDQFLGGFSNPLVLLSHLLILLRLSVCRFFCHLRQSLVIITAT